MDAGAPSGFCAGKRVSFPKTSGIAEARLMDEASRKASLMDLSAIAPKSRLPTVHPIDPAMRKLPMLFPMVLFDPSSATMLMVVGKKGAVAAP